MGWCVHRFHPLDKSPPCGPWALPPGSVPCASCQSVLITESWHRALPVWGYSSIADLYILRDTVQWAEWAFLLGGCLVEDRGGQGSVCAEQMHQALMWWPRACPPSSVAPHGSDRTLQKVLEMIRPAFLHYPPSNEMQHLLYIL